MFLDDFEGLSITADCKKVLPGMVFVDLYQNKSRKDLYSAFYNGASVIFTTQNISDPKLPVIKVNNTYETMMILLNKHFQSPQDKAKLIAVSGSNDKDIVVDLLYKILNENNITYSTGNDFSAEHISLLKTMSIEDVYEYLNKLTASGMQYTPIIVDYKMKYFPFINSFRFDCALITGVSSFDVDDGNYVLSSIRSFAAQIPKNKPIIVNNDDDLVLKALDGSRDTILITYGLNKKAAVTATSININQQIDFNYCLQRSFETYSGKIVEPFEMPITLNMLDGKSIYNALAVITCALYYDIDIEHIKKTLYSYNCPNRRFEIYSLRDISVVDNYCSSEAELDKTLEALQTLNYNDLFILLSINNNSYWSRLEAIMEVFNQWNNILGITELILTSCIDGKEEIAPLSINDIRKLKKSLSSLFPTKYIDKLETAVQYICASTKAGDMLLLAGGDELDAAKALVERQLVLEKQIVDSRNLQ